jgi:hypothetical protein
MIVRPDRDDQVEGGLHCPFIALDQAGLGPCIIKY